MKPILTLLLTLFLSTTVLAGKSTTSILLGDQGYLELSNKYEFVPASKAGAIMNAFGNQVDQDFLGLVLPKQDKDVMGWFIVLRYKKIGYIYTEQVPAFSSMETLKTIKDKIAKVNKERNTQKLVPIEIINWSEEPTFDSKKHQLSFGLTHKGVNLKDSVVNQEVFLLNREGVLDVSLVTYASLMGGHKEYLQDVIHSVHFAPEKGYGDFQEGDRVLDVEVRDILVGKEMPEVNYWQVVGEKVVDILLAIII